MKGQADRLREVGQVLRWRDRDDAFLFAVVDLMETVADGLDYAEDLGPIDRSAANLADVILGGAA